MTPAARNRSGVTGQFSRALDSCCNDRLNSPICQRTREFSGESTHTSRGKPEGHPGDLPWSESVRAVPAREFQHPVGSEPLPGLPGAGRLLVHVGCPGPQGGVRARPVHQPQQVAGGLGQDHCPPGQVHAEVDGHDRVDELVGAGGFLLDEPDCRGGRVRFPLRVTPDESAARRSIVVWACPIEPVADERDE